ncbi:MAG TPA: NAD-dependent epimerase/dehydratase family protein [Clostridia bacterium]|nr:NAD-dependent epimerase/dehydratase family protein [Clostridia bacterium]
MNEKIAVITGASGHIGYALIKELEAKKENFRILIRSKNKIFDGISCERAFGDVTDLKSLEKAFEGADTVYHLAGVIDLGTGNNEWTREVNVQGTINVVEACKKSGVRRLIYASSVDILKPLPGNEMMTEAICYNQDEVNDGVYAQTKSEATRYVLDNADDKLEVVVVMPGACIGPYDFKVSSAGRMIRLVMHYGIPASLDFGAYNFVDVRDVAKGMIGAADKGKTGECYLLTGEVITADELIRLVARSSGRRAPRAKLPLWFVKPLAPLAEVFYKVSGQTPIFTRISIDVINRNSNFSYEKATKDFGYNPMGAKQSIKDTVAWIKATEDRPRKNKKR